MSRFLPFQEIKSLENLPLLAKQVVEGFIIGLHKSPYHGFSVEFAEHRLYNPGDSTKNIDWKVYARTEKLFTKKFEEETNLRCNIILDTSSSMNYPYERLKKEGKFNKLEYGIISVASLMTILKRQRDAFSLTLFDDAVYRTTDCKSSNSHLQLLLSYLEGTQEAQETGKKTSLTKALHDAAASTHTRSLICIFTDLLAEEEDDSKLFDALQHLKFNKHEVLLFHVHDELTEVNLELPNKVHRLIDIETDESIMMSPKEVKDAYKKAVTDRLQDIKLKCHQYKIDFIDLDIRKDFRQVLESYFIKRSKMK